jgi:LPXTG-site transpeptidase (sortase) family protein
MKGMSRRTSIFIAGAITLAGIAVFGFTFVHAVVYSPEGEVAPVPTTTGAAASTSASLPDGTDLPASLEIPALSVDAHVQRVGITRAGNMSAPSNFTDVAWYKYGTVPGQKGSAVMAGHVDNGLALAGVFKHLSDIKVGDDIYIATEAGHRLHFVVSSIQTFEYKDAPSDAIFGEKDKAYLKLLTCTGSWVQSDRTYDHRLVVTAVLAAP